MPGILTPREEKQRAFWELLATRSLQEVAIETRIGQLSGDLREYYRKQHETDGGGKLSTPDAQHLAAAIHYEADVFYTFDGGKKNARSLLTRE